MALTSSPEERPLKPEDELWLKNMIWETFRDLREVVDKMERGRIFREIREDILEFISVYQMKLFMRSIVFHAQLLAEQRDVEDWQLFDVINTVVNSGLTLERKQVMLNALSKILKHNLEQDQDELIDSYKKILLIMPHHILNRAVFEQVTDQEEIDLSLFLEEEPPVKKSSLKSLEKESFPLDHSLLFLSLQDDEVAKNTAPKDEKPSDMEISIEMIFPEDSDTDKCQEAEKRNPEKGADGKPKKEVQSMPVWGQLQRSLVRKRIPIDEAIQRSKERNERQRCYPPHETKPRTPHLETE